MLLNYTHSQRDNMIEIKLWFV